MPEITDTKPKSDSLFPVGRWILIGQFLIGLICVALSYLVPKMQDSFRIDGRVVNFVMVLVLGWIAGVVGMVAIWWSLAPDGIIRRSLATFLAILAATATMGVAIVFYWPSIQPLSYNEDLVGLYYFGFTAPTVFGASLPLLVVRYGFGRLIYSQSHRPIGTVNFSIRDLLITTALVGAFILMVQITKFAWVAPAETRIQDDITSWQSAGIFAGIAFGISLLSILPFSFLLLGERIKFGTGVVASLMLSTLMLSITYVVMIAMGGRTDSIYLCFSLFVYSISICVTCGGLRLLGYQLQKFNSIN